MKMLNIVGAMGIASLAALSASGASAQSASIVVPIDSIISGDAVGSITELTTADVDPTLVGLECIVSAEVLNQDSLHPNNDLIVASAGDVVEFPDIESASFDAITTAQPIVLGDIVTVSVRFGGDIFFSGGFNVVFDCSDSLPLPTTTTTTVVPDTTTTTTVPVPDTTVPAPTTTDEPPEPALPDTTTTTTEPPTTAPPTTVSPSSAPPTTDSPVPPTTEPGSGTPDPRDVLPATGSNLTAMLLGTGFVLAGVGIVAGTRRRPHSL